MCRLLNLRKIKIILIWFNKRFIGLPKPPDVLKAATGPDGILEGLVNGGIWIDHSTTDYEQNLMFEEIASKKDAHILECPITGGPSMSFYPKSYLIFFPKFINILTKFSKTHFKKF